MGRDVDESHFYTSALATARFISSQAPGCSAYVVGGPGLVNALYEAGINIQMINTSEIRVSVLLDEEDVNRAVRAIHDKFFGEI